MFFGFFYCWRLYIVTKFVHLIKKKANSISEIKPSNPPHPPPQIYLVLHWYMIMGILNCWLHTYMTSFCGKKSDVHFPLFFFSPSQNWHVFTTKNTVTCFWSARWQHLFNLPWCIYNMCPFFNIPQFLIPLKLSIVIEDLHINLIIIILYLIACDS